MWRFPNRKIFNSVKILHLSEVKQVTFTLNILFYTSWMVISYSISDSTWDKWFAKWIDNNVIYYIISIEWMDDG